MNEMDKYISFEQFGSGELAVTTESIDERYGKLKKIDLNLVVSDEILDEARQNRYLSENATISEIREYLRVVSSENTKEIEQKHIIYLLMGEADCKRTNFLLSLDPLHPTLKLKTDQRIINFFQLLGRRINIFDLIERSQADQCRPDYCVEIDEEMIGKFQDALKGLCDLLNPEFTMPEVPLLLLIKATETDKAIISSLEAQSEMLFEQAKDIFETGTETPFTKKVSTHYDFFRAAAPAIATDQSGNFSNRHTRTKLTQLFESKIKGKSIKDAVEFEKMVSVKGKMMSSSYLYDLRNHFSDEKEDVIRAQKKRAEAGIKTP